MGGCQVGSGLVDHVMRRNYNGPSNKGLSASSISSMLKIPENSEERTTSLQKI